MAITGCILETLLTSARVAMSGKPRAYTVS
jgi:hypothetical protein